MSFPLGLSIFGLSFCCLMLAWRIGRLEERVKVLEKTAELEKKEEAI